MQRRRFRRTRFCLSRRACHGNCCGRRQAISADWRHHGFAGSGLFPGVGGAGSRRRRGAYPCGGDGLRRGGEARHEPGGKPGWACGLSTSDPSEARQFDAEDQPPRREGRIQLALRKQRGALDSDSRRDESGGTAVLEPPNFPMAKWKSLRCRKRAGSGAAADSAEAALHEELHRGAESGGESAHPA